VKRREGKPKKVCQSHKGNDHSPYRRLGKATLAEASGWRNTTGETPPTTGALLCVCYAALFLATPISPSRPLPNKISGIFLTDTSSSV